MSDEKPKTDQKPETTQSRTETPALRVTLTPADITELMRNRFFLLGGGGGV